MTRSKLTSFILFFLLLGVLFSTTRCGDSLSSDGASSAERTCTPNVIDQGLQMQVTTLTSDSPSYIFKLCAPATSSGAYSVYGGPTPESVSAQTMVPGGAIRKSHIADGNTAGTTFQVDFHPDDSYFAVYQDVELPSGVYGFSRDLSSMMVKPHILPSR